MRPEGCEADLLRAMSAMPFLDRSAMTAVTGWSRGAVYGAVEQLESAGLCASVLHATELHPQARRFYLTILGLRALAGQEDMTLGELLCERPVSARWRNSLMERLDTLASIYVLASAVSNAAFPIRFRWFRAAPLDAAMILPGGRTVGVLRQGPTADRSGFAKRLWRLREEPVPGIVLFLMPDEVRLRHARRALSAARVPTLFALERDAVLAGADDRIWSQPTVGASIDLRRTIDRAAPSGGLPEEPEPRRVDAPADLPGTGAAFDVTNRMLPVLLMPAEKRAIDLINDWPWITPNDLAGLMDVSAGRVSQVVTPLEGFGLVARPREAGGRLALTDRGIALLARRDRTSVAVGRRRWSIAPGDAESPFDWRNVTGGRSRQLLRNLKHTEAVHRFLAALAKQARLLAWEVVQFDPPKRASRHFRHNDRMRSVNPDAFGILRNGETTWPFFLEWERRAVRPSTMSQRLAPYLRYFSSHRPIDDHGVRPAVLIVFDDDLTAAHFLRVAREEMRAERAAIPLWVSHWAAIDALGPLGRAWRSPSRWESPQTLPTL